MLCVKTDLVRCCWINEHSYQSELVLRNSFLFSLHLDSTWRTCITEQLTGLYPQCVILCRLYIVINHNVYLNSYHQVMDYQINMFAHRYVYSSQSPAGVRPRTHTNIFIICL